MRNIKITIEYDGSRYQGAGAGGQVAAPGVTTQYLPRLLMY